jgi:hypothetical protein
MAIILILIGIIITLEFLGIIWTKGVSTEFFNFMIIGTDGFVIIILIF